MLAIISDIHDNTPNLETTLNYCKENNISTIACCGDVCNSDTLKLLATNFPGTIYLAIGNMEIFDIDEPNEYENIKYLGKYGEFKLENKNIGICHEPYNVEKLAKSAKHKLDIIFYGHTHKPWQENKSLKNKDNKVEKIMLVNPGNVGNFGFPATFALYSPENNDLELKLISEL